ncbi:cytochrome b [Bordetella genomosp. 13]|uniref:cytochrome b n=1 Tax=Bordetella genomosp. 13 TaxID=463040 RepID=UPI0016427CB0|nr:cytochrome b/b6 domain-containing protein [Bordetella genomosp. 13]
MSSVPVPDATAGRYDGPTRLLHWATALLIIAIFSLFLIWDALPREQTGPYKHLHVGLGVILAAVFLLRIVWRAYAGRKLPNADPGWKGMAALAMAEGSRPQRESARTRIRSHDCGAE